MNHEILKYKIIHHKGLVSFAIIENYDCWHYHKYPTKSAFIIVLDLSFLFDSVTEGTEGKIGKEKFSNFQLENMLDCQNTW